MSNTQFVNGDLTGASFDGSTMDGVRFSGVSLTEAVFTGAQLHGVAFTGIDITTVMDMPHDLPVCSFQDCVLRGMDFFRG